MDINTITNLETLKALAYDQLVAKERAEANLRAINQRIQQVNQQPLVAEDEKKTVAESKKKAIKE